MERLQYLITYRIMCRMDSGDETTTVFASSVDNARDVFSLTEDFNRTILSIRVMKDICLVGSGGSGC